MPFTAEIFGCDNDGILKVIEEVQEHPHHGTSYRDTKMQWAETGMCVSVNPNSIQTVTFKCLLSVLSFTPSVGRWAATHEFKAILD